MRLRLQLRHQCHQPRTSTFPARVAHRLRLLLQDERLVIEAAHGIELHLGCLSVRGAIGRSQARLSAWVVSYGHPACHIFQL